MEIKEFIDLLPEDYEKECYEKKAIRRKRTIKTPLDLLILLLYYLYDDHSLVDVSQFAILKNIGNISDTALIKKFIQCKDWILWLISKMIPNEIIHYKKPEELEPYRVIAVDASDIIQKGAVKKTWHLHYGVDLFSLTCNQFQLTEQSTGESLKNFEIKEKEEKRLKKLESKKQITCSEDTKFTHQFMFVITSLPSSVSAEKVLEFYRLRWQAELVFKRYKSLLGLGNIPAKTKESSEVWLNGKMFLALLIEKYLGEIDFSPTWNIRTESECVERNEIGTLFDLYDVTSGERNDIFS